MRTNLEFRSEAFPPYADEEEQVNPGRHGKRLADFLAMELPRHGFSIAGACPEDWGWRLDLRNDAFPLWVGCGNNEEYENGFLCFIEPSKPVVRKWLKSVQTLVEPEAFNALNESLIDLTSPGWPPEAGCLHDLQELRSG